MPTRYQCADCSFSGLRFSQGRCPACGSASIHRDAPEPHAGKRGPIGLLICLALWAYLAYEIFLRLEG